MMKNLLFKSYSFIVSIVLLITGIILLAVLSGSVKYFGIILIVTAILFLARFQFSKVDTPDDQNFRSKTREQLLKHQYRK